MDYSKIVNSKTFKVAAWIVLPTILVAGFYGYKYIKNKVDTSKKSEELKKNQERYKKINSVDEFLEGVKYLDETNQYGYDLAKKGQTSISKTINSGRTNKEDEEFLELIHIIFP